MTGELTAVVEGNRLAQVGVEALEDRHDDGCCLRRALSS